MNAQSKQTLKLLGAWNAITHPMTVVQSFIQCGIDVIYNNNCKILRTIVNCQCCKFTYFNNHQIQKTLSKTRIDVCDLWFEGLIKKGLYDDPESCEKC